MAVQYTHSHVRPVSGSKIPACRVVRMLRCKYLFLFGAKRKEQNSQVGVFCFLDRAVHQHAHTKANHEAQDNRIAQHTTKKWKVLLTWVFICSGCNTRIRMFGALLWKSGLLVAEGGGILCLSSYQLVSDLPPRQHRIGVGQRFQSSHFRADCCYYS